MIEARKTFLPKRIWNICKYILALALLWFIYSKTNISNIVELLKSVSFIWLLISFVLFFLMTMMKAMQYYVLSGRQTLYPRVLSIVVIQNVITNFIATGAGIASYLTMFTVDEGIRLRRAATTFLIAKVGDLVVVWFFLLVSCLFLWGRISVLKIPTLTVLTIVPLSIILFIAAIIFRQKFVETIHIVAARLQLDRFSFIQRGFDTLQFLGEQDGHVILRLFQIAIFCSLAYMILTMAWVYASLQVFLMIVPASILIFVNSWIQLISWLPIQVFGGLGVMETSQVYLYSIFGISVIQMATISVGMRVSSYLFNLLSLLYLPLYKLFQRNESSDNLSKDQND